MLLQDIVGALPQEWVVRSNRRAQKHGVVMGVRQKRAVLNPYEIGLQRVKEMMVPFDRFTEGQITEIGQCSIDRTYILVTRVESKWAIMPCTPITCKNGGYIVKGKKVIPLQHHKKGTLEELMRAFEYGKDCPLDRLDADGLFYAFQGKRVHKGKKKGGESSAHQACKCVCKVQDLSRPWKRGERVHYRSENAKRREAERKEQNVFGIIRVARVGLIYKSQTKATQANCTGRRIN